MYLLYDRVDEPVAAELQDWLFEQGMEVSIPDGALEEEQAGSIARPCPCDAVVVYFGEVRRTWVETRAAHLLKAPGFGRTTPFSVKAVYRARAEISRSNTSRRIWPTSSPGKPSSTPPAPAHCGTHQGRPRATA